MREARPEDLAMVRRLARALLRAWTLTDTQTPVPLETWAELSASHEALVLSQLAPNLNIGLNKLDYDRRLLLDDTEEAAHKGFARTLHRAGLRQIRVAAPALSSLDWQRFVETLTKHLGRADQIDGLVVALWKLDLRQIEIRAIDGPDDTTFAAKESSKTLAREDFMEQFLFRVRQTFSALVTEARIGAARRSLEDGVGCDSVSLESQFNLVFRRRGSSENQTSKGDDSAVYEPGLVDRLTQSLGARASTLEDDELRALLREQLSRSPALTDDTTLLRHTVSVVAELESLQPPMLTALEAAAAYSEIASAALASGNLERALSLLSKLASSASQESKKQLSVSLTTQGLVDQLLKAALGQSARGGQEALRQELSGVLPSLLGPRLSELLSEFLRASEHPREAWQLLEPSLNELAQQDPRALIPILRLEDEWLSEQGFELLSRRGAAAVPVIQGFMAEGDERRTKLALRALKRATEAAEDEIP